MAEELFVDKHRVELIQRVKNISPILDGLLSYSVINEESYDEIMAIPDSREKMRALFSGPLESGGVQGKEIFYNILNENEPYLIDELKRTEYKNVVDKVRVETMTAQKMLFETLNDLSSEELEGFKSLIELENGFPLISRRRLKGANTQDIVELMVEIYGQQTEEVTREVLKKMNRTDLVQRLSDISSGTREKHSVDEQRPALIQRVETMASVIELLLETLAGLSDGELKKFKSVMWCQIHFARRFSDFPSMLLETADMQVTVFLIVEIFGQQSVEKTKEVLKMMKRTDLVQRLSDSSSGPKKKHSVDEHLSALIHKVATMSAVKELLLETLDDLSHEDLKKFKWLLQFVFFQRSLPHVSWTLLQTTHRADQLVDLMVEMCGQQSVEVTMEVFMDMNRTDLMQRLSETSSGSKAAGSSAEAFGVNTTEGEKLSVDEHWPALIQEVETMASVIELLLETLAGLSDSELEKFKDVISRQIHFPRRFSDIPSMLLETADMQVTVFSMVEIFGQQCVEKTKEVLKMMKRTDLVQRLSDSSSGPKKKHSADEHRSALIHKVATKAAVEQLLLETLNDLSNEELKRFKKYLKRFEKYLQFSFYQKDPLVIFRRVYDSALRQSADRADTVDVMVQIHGQQSLEVTREVLKKMNRTDLVQRLSKSSSEKHRPALLERVRAMAAAERILSETLNDLSYEELEKFSCLLRFTYFQKSLPQIPRTQLKRTNRADLLVNLMVKSHVQQSVELTKEVFMDMNRTDLVERLSESSSGLKEKHPSKVFQKEVTMTSLQEKLLEALEDLSYGELQKFKRLLQHTEMKKGLPTIQRRRMEMADRVEMVELMEEIYGQQSEEVTREVLKKMNRTDLVQWLSNLSLGSKEKHPSKPFQKEVTMTSLQEKLLEALEDLNYGELQQFKRLLQHTEMKKGLPTIQRRRMEMADRVEMVELMEEIYGQQSEEVTREVLKKMNRTDLVQLLSNLSLGSKEKHPSKPFQKEVTVASLKRLSDISPESTGPSRSLELEGCGSIAQDSSDWTELEPEANSTDADEALIYSLQSEAGNFECNVSGLRWVCKEKVSFKYQFCSWADHMERMESLTYMPAGPLMDITVIAGKLFEVYLPHWICIDDIPKILDKFAVLHIEDSGDVVEKVSEVTPSHVKLPEPIFSPRGVLMKVGIPVKIDCDVLIYKTNTAFLTLHVYLIPNDPALQQAMDKRESSYGYKVIRKPHPEKSLKMRDRFILTADLDGAEISPENVKLRHKNPNFFEVFIENPDRNFMLKLTQKDELQPVWTCAIRKDEYQSTAHIQGEHFVDKHQFDLIERVSNTKPILDNLLKKGVIQQEDYDTIGAIQTKQEMMRKLYSGPLKAGGQASKDVFYEILEEKESYLVADLKGKAS